MTLEEQVRDLQYTTQALQLILAAAFNALDAETRKLVRLRATQIRQPYEATMNEAARLAVAERVRMLLGEYPEPAGEQPLPG